VSAFTALRPGIAALPLLWALGCGADPDRAAIHIDVRSLDGTLPPRYRIVFGTEGSELWRVTCPEGESAGPLRCAAAGATVERVPPDAVLTVKAPGYSFVTTSLSAEQRAAGRVTVELASLPPFERTDDFRTGIEVDDGERTFLDFAVPSHTELGQAHSVKFYIAGLPDQPKVYFQNTRRHPVHYDFVHLALGLPLSRAEFEQQTYRGEGRPAMAGTLMYYPSLRFPSDAHGAPLNGPIALEFFPSDDLTASQALTVHRLLEERLLWLGLGGPERRLVYLPAGSVQERELRAAQGHFARADALFGDRVQFYAGVEQQVLNAGLAYGTLRLFTPEQLARAVVSFRDIAVLTRLPNDLPLVGGTITEELQTPLAHVNLAARARGTPNLGLRSASVDGRIAPLLEQLVRFEVTSDGFSLAPTTLEEAQAFWQSRTREPLLPASDVEFVGLPSFGDIPFTDSLRFGVKAANLSELRKVLGDLAPAGFGVPFSAYHQYMSNNRVTETLCDAARVDCEREGRTADLCDRARAHCATGTTGAASFYAYVDQLLRDDGFLTDTALREACLDGLKYLVGHGTVDAVFGAALDARIGEVFGTGKVRLRSSTNAEDLPGFSGAGLYESLSAYASGSDRASLRVREVWASVWEFRAFEERQFWNIDHRAIRMALAVNLAIDDEAANGVLITRDLAHPEAPGLYVNVQAGEVEVTNPENGAIPEVFSIVPAPNESFQVVRQRFSSLSSGKPLLEDAEIVKLARAAELVQLHFTPLYDDRADRLVLDLEFKFHGPERRLLIKQARPYFSSKGSPAR
jgi:hypothetical protein